MVKTLDDNLGHYAAIIKRDLGKDVAAIPGAGAAGGLGAGLVAFLDAELKRGVELVIEYARLKERIQGADFVITGEGRYDSQTAKGKTPLGVAMAAAEQGIPSILIAGSIADDADISVFERVYALAENPEDVDDAIARAAELIEKRAFEFAISLKAAQ
jgi:glycerate kinase